ncbi:conserved membrane hypothetical protein [Nostocoides japonicum T1-X7]|uniref:Uncharacterized protein n=1 Tax=Nostocoides japonicum T1-X7 TaxID=1194083 RepID=A0A077M267_9MICO|nr:lysylphosphatidylglycerol synthase domain-containing protein [Tetrasphaera japonica]CCH78265.1 conserved membrane hypothetical protein [Tetrasphaera japonica T1-X7]
MALPPRLRTLVTVLRYGALVLVLLLVVVALARNWQSVSRELGSIPRWSVAGAFALTIVSGIFAMLSWRVLLADLGTRLHLADAAGIFFVGQLGKYVPGSVWSVVMQAEMAARLKVPRRRTAVAGLLLLGMSGLTAALVGIPGLPILLARNGHEVWWPLVGACIVVGLVALSPPVLNRLIAVGLRVLRREPLEHALTTPAITLATVFSVLSWTFLGAGCWVLAQPMASDEHSAGRVFVVAVFGYVMAAVIGMISFFLPAGVGVRDGVFLVMLSGLMSPAAATAVVVVFRFVTVLADIVFALFGWLWAKGHELLPSRADRDEVYADAERLAEDEDRPSPHSSGH